MTWRATPGARASEELSIYQAETEPTWSELWKVVKGLQQPVESWITKNPPEVVGKICGVLTALSPPPRLTAIPKLAAHIPSAGPWHPALEKTRQIGCTNNCVCLCYLVWGLPDLPQGRKAWDIPQNTGRLTEQPTTNLGKIFKYLDIKQHNLNQRIQDETAREVRKKLRDKRK